MGKEPQKEVVAKKECENQLNALKAMISKKENDLSQREKTLQEKESALSTREIDAQNNFPKLFEEKFSESIKQLKDREDDCTSEWEDLEAEKQMLRDREREIQKGEIERDQGYADKKAHLKKELAALKKEKHQELVDELENERERRLEEINNEVKSIRDSLEQNKAELDTRQIEVETQEDTLNFNEQKINAQQSSLQERMQYIDKEVDKKIEARQQSFEVEKQSLRDEINRLRNSISSSSELIGSFEELKRKLGNEAPEAVLSRLKTHEETIKNLKQKLIDRPTKEMQLEFDRLNQENEQLDSAYNRLSDENVELKEIADTQEQLELNNKSLDQKNQTLNQLYESIEADNNRLHDELKRLQASYEREADREARIRDIQTPYINTLPDINQQKEISEIEWLDSINHSIEDYGFKFPRRILHAFHTSLKTSEWSPLTVLAGVSGTGKSELPRLYSHFGGVNFLSLAVQPNWDSQESMLGFFNSIDNKFDAQPVLRFLAQTQEKSTEDYPGLKDNVNLILMDEMNLAHVELYFAEFLSKLELRRGTKGNIPSIDIKLGAGIEPYQLPLGRNVLWVGTMNQDETTKSLSDKVLDRGIVINFPRPTSFERRKQLKPLGEQALMLPRTSWESWWKKQTGFEDKQLLPYKTFVEEMNESLSKVGRALGHRVWQSVEYYMANYPDVIQAQEAQDDNKLKKAMKTAFEDQLVQKVMPKLRGIETRGKSKTDCLDKIRSQLDNGGYNIVEDFDLACEFGYGQFIWSSANYLNINNTSENELTECTEPSLEKQDTNLDSPSKDKNSISVKIIKYAKMNNKELWELTIKQVMEVMGCTAKEAKLIKDKVNATKNN